MNADRNLVRYGLVLVVVLGISATPRAAEIDDALRKFKVPDGFAVKVVAAEPDVRKPVTISFDDRGRMWLIQYLQYPAPAGLKPVKVDQYLRTVYDRIPEPPPKGPKGIDRITILDDPDANGRYRKVKDFHVGLNLASGFALGHGGIFVAQPPYLLFYKIKEGEDVPAGDPEVLLTGFGMEDAHAFPNSLQWGPDGWLYGAQGSTVTANIRGIEFQQGIWRYHPITKEFELFAEGGGNTWGVDFDRHGNIIAGTNWGGQAALHQVQGGYYIKGFAKHGPLHNPYTFGYFDHIPYTGFKGGHVTCGGIIYQGGAFPEKYNNQYIAANLLSSAIHWHILEPKGSSFTARHGGELMTTDEPTFRPVDCLTGPDGALYIADWCDKRSNHVDPVDNWDRTRGRVWKLENKATAGVQPLLDLAKKPLSKYTSAELLPLLSHPNSWYHGEARRILAERRDMTVIPALKKLIEDNKGELALEALWALYVSGGFDAATAPVLLAHPNDDVRAWSVRLLCDAKKLPSERFGVQSAAAWLARMAKTDPSPRVRSQLACSARRLPWQDCLQIVENLILREEDANDPHIPLLIWWAIEKQVADHPDAVAAVGFRASNALVKNFLAERLARRLMAEGTKECYETCAALLAASAVVGTRSQIIAGMEKGLEGRTLTDVPNALLKSQLAEVARTQDSDPTFIRLMLRLNDPTAQEKAIQRIGDSKTPQADRLALIETLGQIGKPDCVPVLLKLLRESTDGKIRAASLISLQRFPDASVPASLLELYAKLPADLRSRAQTLLANRQASALDFLKLVDAGKIDKKEVPLDVLQRVVLYKDEQINKLVEKHWGKVGAQSSGEKQSRIRSVGSIVRRGKGDPLPGKELFTKTCATCHVLFGEGNKVGPELTGLDRKNLDFLVFSIVDPSAFIRPEFVAHVVATKDGRVLTGLIAEDSPRALTLLDAKNERTVIARDSIDEMSPSPLSLMPEKLLDSLTDQQICDLFAYLQSNPGATPQAAAPATPLKVLLISGSLEYKSDDTLAEFQKFLESKYNVKCLRAFRKTDTDVPGLDQLDSCDVALFFTRRLTIDGEQLERIQKYCKAGKPIVAIRTASHGFQNWLAMDKEVFGGNYGNHYKEGPLCAVKIVAKAKDHPLLQGVKEYNSVGSLYKNQDIARDCEVLLTGSIPEHTEPIAWTRTHNGGRIFYTSLGHPKDFEEESFRQLVVNALFWTARREVPKK